MEEEIFRWNVGDKFTEALTEAASAPDVIASALAPSVMGATMLIVSPS